MTKKIHGTGWALQRLLPTLLDYTAILTTQILTPSVSSCGSEYGGQPTCETDLLRLACDGQQE